MKWRTCRLGDVLTLKRGHDLPGHSRQDGDVPVVSSSGITGYHKDAKAIAPGVVTGRYGTLGEVFYLERDYWPLNTALYVVDFKGTHPRFAAYFLKNVLKDYQSDKAAVPGVDRNVLHELKVNAPDQTTQERIAAILSTYDDLIENNRRRMVLLEDAARQVYQEWFVRLRFPGHEHTRIVDGVPEGWKKGNAGHFAEVKSGYAFKSTNWQSDGNPVIKIANILGDNNIAIDSCQCVDDNVAEKASRFSLNSGDLLIAMTGATVGKVGIMPRSKNTYYLNQRVGRFSSRLGLDVSPLLLSFFSMEDAQAQIINYAAGAAQPNISSGQIEAIKLLIPEMKFIRLYLEFAVPLFEQRLSLVEQNQKLRAARDLLLPKLMSGEISV